MDSDYLENLRFKMLRKALEENMKGDFVLADHYWRCKVIIEQELEQLKK